VATVIPARPPATFLKPLSRAARTDISLLVQASQEALSLHGRSYDRARSLRDIPCGVYCCA
jgi:hypothetical protein